MKRYLQILAAHPKPLRFLVARALTATGLCRLFTLDECGFRLRFHPANLSEQLFINPSLRDESCRFFFTYLKAGDWVVDVGANVGDTALASACAVGPAGRVFAVEAHARTYKFLVENILLNQSLCIVPICSAVGAHQGCARMSDHRHDDMNRIGEGSLSVQVNQLDGLVPSQRPYALVKVDVEGYEKFVLEGAGGVLSRTACAYIEVADEHFAHFGYTTSDVIDVLCQYGFECYRFTSANSLERLPRAFKASGCENIVAIRSVSDFHQRTGWHVS